MIIPPQTPIRWATRGSCSSSSMCSLFPEKHHCSSSPFKHTLCYAVCSAVLSIVFCSDLRCLQVSSCFYCKSVLKSVVFVLYFNVVFMPRAFLFFFFCSVRAAMTSIKQLRGDLTTSGDQPSTKLKNYFKVRLVFSFRSIHPYMMFSVEFRPLSMCFVIRIALWTRRRTSSSAWRPSERRSA